MPAMDADQAETAAVVVGTWRRRTTTGRFETVRLARAGSLWEVHATGRPPLRGLTQSRALAVVAQMIGDAWVYYPPPRRSRRPVAR